MDERRDQALNEEIAKRLKLRRTFLKITQEQVVDKLGLNICRIEKGKTGINVTTLSRLCKYYNITMSELLLGLDDAI